MPMLSTQIRHNVAYHALGHCYFLEDGVEAGTELVGNLGLSTFPGTTIPRQAAVTAMIGRSDRLRNCFFYLADVGRKSSIRIERLPPFQYIELADGLSV